MAFDVWEKRCGDGALLSPDALGCVRVQGGPGDVTSSGQERQVQRPGPWMTKRVRSRKAERRPLAPLVYGLAVPTSHGRGLVSGSMYTLPGRRPKVAELPVMD